jgi:hypothetical protein
MNIETGRTTAATHAMYSRASWPFIKKCFLDSMSHDEYHVLTFLLVQGFLIHVRQKTYDSSDTVEVKDKMRCMCAIK